MGPSSSRRSDTGYRSHRAGGTLDLLLRAVSLVGRHSGRGAAHRRTSRVGLSFPTQTRALSQRLSQRQCVKSLEGARTAGRDIPNGEIVFAKSSGAPTGVRCLQMQVQMIRDDYETACLLSRGERNLCSACQAQKGACRLTCGVISRRESIGTPRLPFLPTFFGSVSSVLLGQAPCLAAAPGLCPHPTKASRKSRPPSRQSAQPRARERSSVVPVGLHAPSPESSIGGQRDTRFHWPSRSHSQPVATAAVNTS